MEFDRYQRHARLAVELLSSTPERRAAMVEEARARGQRYPRLLTLPLGREAGQDWGQPEESLPRTFDRHHIAGIQELAIGGEYEQMAKPRLDFCNRPGAGTRDDSTLGAMTGLIVLGIAVLWLLLAAKVAGWVARSFGRRAASSMAGLAAFLVVTFLPFADEVVGRWQFSRLCATEAIVWTHSDAGKVEAAHAGPGHGMRERDGFVFPVKEQVLEYVDVATGQPFFRRHSFITPGGFVMRAGLNMGNLTSCMPENALEISKNLKLNELLTRGGT